MKKGKLVLLVILALALIVLPLITSCVPKKSLTPTNTEPTTNTSSIITSLERRVSQIESTTSSIQNQLNNVQSNAGKNYDNDISNLQSQDSNINQRLNSIESMLSQIQSQLDQLEETQQEVEENSYTTKWYPEISTNATDNVSVTLSAPRIEDEGSYRMTIIAENTSTEDIKNVIIEVYLTPRAGDHVYLESGDTFMDSVGSPFIWWDTEIRERGSDDYAGAIICDSEYITLPPGETIFKSEFTLTYASE